MKITKIAASYGRTYNLGEFNSARLDFQCEAELEPREDPKIAADALWKMCRAEVNLRASALAEALKLKKALLTDGE